MMMMNEPKNGHQKHLEKCEKLQRGEGLSDEEWKAFMEHEKSCPQCREKNDRFHQVVLYHLATPFELYKTEQQVSDVLDWWNNEIPTRKQNLIPVFTPYLKYAAAFLLVAGAVSLIWLWSQNNNTAIDKELLAMYQAQHPEDFTENEYLETQKDQEERSSDYSVELEHPKSDAMLKGNADGSMKIHFEGIITNLPGEKKENFSVRLFSNKEVDYREDISLLDEPLILQQDGEKKYKFRAEHPLQLTPGLYYFRIEEQGDPVYVGSFIVAPEN